MDVKHERKKKDKKTLLPDRGGVSFGGDQKGWPPPFLQTFQGGGSGKSKKERGRDRGNSLAGI